MRDGENICFCWKEIPNRKIRFIWLHSASDLQISVFKRLPFGLDGRGVWGEWIPVYVWLSPFAVHLKLSQHC